MLKFDAPNNVVGKPIDTKNNQNPRVHSGSIKVAFQICRKFNCADFLKKYLESRKIYLDAIICSGMGPAATFIKRWCCANLVPFTEVKAITRTPDGQYNRGAVFRRNNRMLERADISIFFWDGASDGTSHTLNWCIEKGKKKVVYFFDEKNERVVRST